MQQFLSACKPATASVGGICANKETAFSTVTSVPLVVGEYVYCTAFTSWDSLDSPSIQVMAPMQPVLLALLFRVGLEPGDSQYGR